ncbi:MAG: amidohydrolase [Holophaga sp.]|nr:amidohydrolase [Holophaga sp.]
MAIGPNRSAMNARSGWTHFLLEEGGEAMTNNEPGDHLLDVLNKIQELKPDLVSMSDFIFDHPEIGLQEVQASQLLSGYLKKNGFEIEMGYGGLPTAFRAVLRHGSGGPCIGLLCEYDAIENVGHACGHQMQGPGVAGAAMAIQATVGDHPYTLEVIGTPSEESGEGGKTIMLRNGAFKHLDVALMMHGGDATQTDIKAMAITEFLVTFKGLAAHAAIAPDQGRSALDALLLVFNGIGFLRGNVRDDTRINYIVENGGQAIGTIPEMAVARIKLRSYQRPYLDQVIERFLRILDGAALMTGTSCEVKKVVDLHNKIPVLSLNRLVMRNAERVKAKSIMPPREKTGSTDFASVMYFVPGTCIRVPFVEKGVPSHSQAWLHQGKSVQAHDALALGAGILALTALDLIEDGARLAEVQEEFRQERARLAV